MRLIVRGLKGFEWDDANWSKSALKHGVATAEAEEVLLGDPLCHVDDRHSGEEQRYVALGSTSDGRRLFVAFTVRTNRVRIVSARPMSRKEREIYEKTQAKRN